MRRRGVAFLLIGVLGIVGAFYFNSIYNQVKPDAEKTERAEQYNNEKRPKYTLSEKEKAVNQKRLERYYANPILKSTSALSSYANGKIEGSWEQVKFLSSGKTGYGFRVDGSVYDQKNDVIYAISYAGHIWKINRNGSGFSDTEWVLMNHKDNFLTSYIDGLNINGGAFRMVRSADNGMQYSDDEGRTWSAAGGVTAVDKTYEGAIATNSGANRVFTVLKTSSSNLQVYVSSNNGESYSALSTKFNPSAYTVKMFKVLNSESVFIAAYSKQNSKISLYECNPGDSDFSLVNTSTSTFVGIDRVFGTFYNDNYHFYIAAKNTHIYYSEDKGSSWLLKNSTNNSDGDTNPRTVHARKPNVIFKGYLDVNMSVDYGETFTNFSHLLGWDVHHMKMYQKKDGNYFHFVGKDFGCYIADQPEYKSSYVQLNNTAPTQMCYDADHGQNYYSSFTSTQDRGTMGYETYTNESLTTDVKTTDGLRVTIGNNEESVWTWMYYGSIFRKANFAVRNSGLAQIDWTGNWWAAPMIPSPDKKEDAVYVASGSSLTKFTYNPSSNSIIQTNHYFDFGAESGSEITGFGYSPLNPKRWYVSVKTGDFFYSNDGGQTFNESAYSGLFPRANDQSYNYQKNQHVIKASNIDEERVYYAGVGNLFMISDDGGKTFINHSSGLDIYRIRDFDFSPDEKFIFAACANGGIWVYSVDDDKWYEMNDEAIPFVNFTDVEYIVRENTVNFATYGNGIIKLKLEGVAPAVAYPDSLIAELDENNQVKLAWKDNSDNEIAFIIQRAQAGAFEQIGTVSSGQTSYIDMQLPASGDYTYRVKAINSTESSNYSNYAVVTILPEGEVSKKNWTLVGVDSEETNYEASKAFDDDASTMWHTQWTVTPKPDYPHTLIINMHETLTLHGFSYLPRQDNQWNGTIRDYEFYVSTDNSNWTKVASGSWAQTKGSKEVDFSSPQQARYLKLVAISEVTGSVYASCAELSVYTQPSDSKSKPNTPEFVQGGRASDTEIELIWLDMSGDENGFVVEQLIDGNFTEIYTSGPNVTSYKLQNTTTNAAYTFRVAAFNSEGTSDYSRTLTLDNLDTPVNVNERTLQEDNIIVYPNPFTNELNIRINGFEKFESWQILDMSGRQMKNGSFSGYSSRESINVQELKSGQYLIRLIGGNGSVCKSIIKK